MHVLLDRHNSLAFSWQTLQKNAHFGVFDKIWCVQQNSYTAIPWFSSYLWAWEASHEND